MTDERRRIDSIEFNRYERIAEEIKANSTLNSIVTRAELLRQNASRSSADNSPHSMVNVRDAPLERRLVATIGREPMNTDSACW